MSTLNERLIELGDVIGHDFRGNQWTGGGGSSAISTRDSMKYTPRGTSTTLERAKGGALRVDKAISALRTGSSPLGSEGAAKLHDGAHVGVVVNGDAWHAEVVGEYNPTTDSVMVKYHPERNLAEVSPDSGMTHLGVVGIASVSSRDLYPSEAIDREKPDALPKLSHHGEGGMHDKYGTIAASLHVGEFMEFNACTKCGGEVTPGRETCQNCGGSTTTASLSARIERMEAGLIELARLEFGDSAGHPFRGNQWSDGGGPSDPENIHVGNVKGTDKAPAGSVARAREAANPGLMKSFEDRMKARDDADQAKDDAHKAAVQDRLAKASPAKMIEVHQAALDWASGRASLNSSGSNFRVLNDEGKRVAAPWNKTVKEIFGKPGVDGRHDYTASPTHLLGKFAEEALSPQQIEAERYARVHKGFD